MIPANVGTKNSMRIFISTPAELGLAMRAVRQSSKIRIDDLAAMTGVSKQFTSEVEHGKPTVQLGLVLKLLEELGMPLTVDIPESKMPAFKNLQAKGLRPLRPRR